MKTHQRLYTQFHIPSQVLFSDKKLWLKLKEKHIKSLRIKHVLFSMNCSTHQKLIASMLTGLYIVIRILSIIKVLVISNFRYGSCPQSSKSVNCQYGIAHQTFHVLTGTVFSIWTKIESVLSSNLKRKMKVTSFDLIF